MITLETRVLPLLGTVTLAARPDGLCAASLAVPQEARAEILRRHTRNTTRREPPGDSAATRRLLQRAWAQLEEYLARARTEFNVPLAAGGTVFQRLVWDALTAIPYGETRSYGQIAAALGRPRAARAVGAAVGANPLCIFLPCHRVIGADGSLTGFAYGLPVKERLLLLERNEIDASRQDSDSCMTYDREVIL